MHTDGVVAIEFGGKARDKRVAEGPGLRTEVADILHAEARLFHHLAVNGLFEALAHFHKARNQEETRIRIVDVVGHQELVAVADGHNHDRRDARVNDIPAFRTNYRTFMASADSHVPATATELVERFPVSDMCGSGTTHAFHGIHGTESAVAHVLVTRRDNGGSIGRLRGNAIIQEKCRIVYAEKVMTFEIGERLAFEREQFAHAGNCETRIYFFKESLCAIITNNKVGGLRVNDLEFVTENVRCNLVNHDLVISS